MGFKYLHAFNVAMLAKQCWRLINNPDTLCARVLRAKYYPDGNLLKAGNKKVLISRGKVWCQDCGYF